MKSAVLVCSLILLVLGSAFASGYVCAKEAIEPEIITVTKVIERHFHTSESTVQAIYIDKPVEVDKLVYVDKPFYLPSPNNRHFTSLAEAYQWLKNDKTDELEYTGPNPNAIDCDNFAYILQANADRAGYLVSVQCERDHLYNTILIGNLMYGIEPQTDRIWKIGELD